MHPSVHPIRRSLSHVFIHLSTKCRDWFIVFLPFLVRSVLRFSCPFTHPFTYLFNIEIYLFTLAFIHPFNVVVHSLTHCLVFFLIAARQISTHVAAWNKTHLLSQSFHGLGVWAKLNWILCSWYHQAAVMTSAGAGFYLALRDLFQAHVFVGRICFFAIIELMAARLLKTRKRRTSLVA